MVADWFSSRPTPVHFGSFERKKGVRYTFARHHVCLARDILPLVLPHSHLTSVVVPSHNLCFVKLARPALRQPILALFIQLPGVAGNERVILLWSIILSVSEVTVPRYPATAFQEVNLSSEVNIALRRYVHVEPPPSLELAFR